MGTPKEQWPIAEALVFSVDWVEPTRNDFGHYTLVYSYRVDNERFTGEFRDYTEERDNYLHRDDVISIRYCPEHPSRSFYPETKSVADKRLLFLGIGAGLAVIVFAIVYLSGGFR
jgi:hypothetical protein